MNTRCCGVGGMVYSSPPELCKRVYTRRANDFNSDYFLTYCGSFRGTMQAAGKDAVHILNLIFGLTYFKKDRKLRGYKSEDKMWINCKKAKYRLDNLK